MTTGDPDFHQNNMNFFLPPKVQDQYWLQQAGFLHRSKRMLQASALGFSSEAFDLFSP